MKDLLLEAKNFKIVPENYRSATVFEIENIDNSTITVILKKISDEELKDYKKDSTIEAFGVAKRGLLFFKSKIIDTKDNKCSIQFPEKIDSIQRRKYSRVPFDGELKIKDNNKIKIKTCDISAGGLKFISDTPFMVGEKYDVRVELINNLVVDAAIQPIRVEEDDDESGLKYSISAKYQTIRSIDRIALMQFSLRRINEIENKS